MLGQVRVAWRPWRTLRLVVKVVVDVMLKPEIRDPQGEAIVGACHRLGFTDVRSVRQGKRFEVEIDDGQDPAARTAELAAELLANPVIEEFIVSSPHGGYRGEHYCSSEDRPSS